MKLHFAPFAASLAVRIALYEAGVDAEYVEVDLRTKRLLDGSDYRGVHPIGVVPMLELDDGTRLLETSAILLELARRYPAARLAPTDPGSTFELQRWLGFVGAELHRGIFGVLVDRSANPGAKEYALARAPVRLAHLAEHLEEREFLLDAFSVADAYLVAILGTSGITPIVLSDHPPIAAYAARLAARPSIARAQREERALYAAAIARAKTAAA